MLNVSQFIADHITGRQKSMFAADIGANRDKLRAEIEGKRVLVIGGAGTIGSSYIRAVLPLSIFRKNVRTVSGIYLIRGPSMLSAIRRWNSTIAPVAPIEVTTS